MSSVSQPERVTFDSVNDITQQGSGVSNYFVNLFNPSILAPHSISLIRATIPNVSQPNIPDYSLVFYYYAMGSQTTTPSSSTLRAIRLYPSNYVPPNGFTNYTKNRVVTGGADFVNLLNAATVTAGDSVTYNKLFTAGDITFTWNTTTQTITWQGNTSGTYYSNAGWNDPNVLAVQNITATSASNAINVYNFDTTVSLQPQLLETTLNLRVGYAQGGSSPPDRSFPTGTLTNASSYSIQNANLTGRGFNGTAVSVPVDSFPNLVYTQNIYVYTDWTTGVGQQGLRNLLAIIPVTTSQFGVIQYTPTTPSKFKRIPGEIFQLAVRLLDDNGRPFTIPDSANLNLEFHIHYDEVKS